MLIGTFLPFWGDLDFTMWDDPVSAATWFAGAVLVIVGGAVGSKGNPSGPSFAGGIGFVFGPIVAYLVWFFLEINVFSEAIGGGSIGMGPGFVAWILAVALLLPAMAMAVFGSTSDQVRRPGWLAPIAVLGALVWTMGVVQPPFGNVGVWDNLFGSGDARTIALNAVLVGGPALAVLLAVARKAAQGYAFLAGIATVWLLIWFAQAQAWTSSGTEFTAYLEGQFAATTFGLVALLVAGILGGFVRRDVRDDEVGGTPAMLLASVAAVLALLAGVAADDESFGGDDNYFGDEFYFETDGGGGGSHEDLVDPCIDGDMDACDELYRETPVGSREEDIGATCGNRNSTWSDAGSCSY